MVAQPASDSKSCKSPRYAAPARAFAAPTQRRLVVLSAGRAGSSDGGSSNGRTADSDSASLGSNPSPPANLLFYYLRQNLFPPGVVGYPFGITRTDDWSDLAPWRRLNGSPSKAASLHPKLRHRPKPQTMSIPGCNLLRETRHDRCLRPVLVAER
jgi:hypothetical protein